MKNKILNFIKVNIFEIILFISMFFYILSKIMCREIGNLDELWIFNMARNFANGLIPYRDFNLVITPGITFLCGIFLKVFGTELLYMRIIGVASSFFIIFFIYKILSELQVNRSLCKISIIGITYLFIEHFCIDYNFIVLLIALISLYIEIKKYKKNGFFYNKFKFNFFFGVLVGLAFAFKQTVGMAMICALAGYKILCIKNKEDFMNFLKLFVYRILGSITVCALLLLYFLFTNSLKEFINYAFLGISSFSNTISYLSLFESNIEIRLLANLVPLTFAAMIALLFFRRSQEDVILFGFSVPLVIIMYPIADEIHFLISVCIILVVIIYYIEQIAKIIISKVKISQKIIIGIHAFLDSASLVVGSWICIISIINLINTNFSSYDKLENYKYVPISNWLENSIINVDEYIKNKESKVYILDARAVAYLIPLNVYNKDFDMLNTGNLGKDGVNRIINELKQEEKITLLMVKDSNSLNWQTPKEIINFSKSYFDKVDEIEYFEVYE